VTAKDRDGESEQGNCGRDAKLGSIPQASNINEALREKSSGWEAKLNAGQFLQQLLSLTQ
jgi:hypothetical protein